MTEIKAGVTNSVRRVLFEAKCVEARGDVPSGFRVWPSKRHIGWVYVEFKRHPDRFNINYAIGWANGQIAKYMNLLREAGYEVLKESRPVGDRIRVRKAVAKGNNGEERHMLTQCITVPSSAEERYDEDFPTKVLDVLILAGVEATDIGGGSDMGGNADNDFELKGDEVALARAKAAVRKEFGRDVRTWTGGEDQS